MKTKTLRITYRDYRRLRHTFPALYRGETMAEYLERIVTTLEGLQ